LDKSRELSSVDPSDLSVDHDPGEKKQSADQNEVEPDRDLPVPHFIHIHPSVEEMSDEKTIDDIQGLIEGFDQEQFFLFRQSEVRES
jgi:hypothetical protein